MSAFSKDKSGSVILNPLGGYSTGRAYEMMGILRLEYFQSPQEREPSGWLQMGLTPVQARALAESLLAMADSLEKPSRSTDRPKN